jgi:cold shock CspA family protein
MPTGTISDFETAGLFGLINADDGRLIVFNLHAMQAPSRNQFTVGTRVEFVEQHGRFTQRAATLSRVIVS